MERQSLNHCYKNQNRNLRIQLNPAKKKVIQDFSTQAFKSYVPKNVSSSWYDYWKAIELFDEVDGARELSTYSITSFPQKLNGANHLGNAFQQIIQDALARYNKMNNAQVLRIQAYHDGGIAVEDALETKLLNDKKSKYSLSKDEFLDKIKELARKNLIHAENQIQKLGIFTSTRYKYNTADFDARETTKGLFIELYKAGLIERRPSMINWSYYLHSPVPDTDIKYMNVKGKTMITVPGYDEPVEFGVINDLIYKIENSEEYLVIATTKPETMFADVAVLIHPEDKRYQHLVGKNAIHPVSGKLLPIIFDDELVNIEFGTGAVRLAPSNNLKDYKIGLKYGLEFIQIFNSDGTLNKNCGKGWEGLKRFEARKKILETLKAKGLFISQKDNPMRIQVSLKTGDVVEKRLHSHWWLKTQNLLATNSNLSKKVVKKLEGLKISPAIYKEKLLQKIEDFFETTDLILSTEKTLSSSSAIPAYYVELEGANNDTNFNINDYWVVAQTEKEAEVEAKKKFNNVKLLRKDEDDIESWFFEVSSPIVSLQKETTQAASELVCSFEPHDLIVSTVSEHDFELLAKSIMVSLILTNGDKMPFREVLIHPAAADFNERKLSKRLGNAFDPLFVIDGYDHTEITNNFTEFAIANDKELKKLIKAFHTKFPKGFNELGADVFRLYFLRNLEGEDAQTLKEKFVFNNLAQIDNEKKSLSKVYQLVKFSILELTNANSFEQYAKSDFEIRFNYDKWILDKLSSLIIVLTKSIKSNNFSQYISSINDFWINDVNNVYFEVVKNKLLSLHEDDNDRLNSKKILYYVIETALRMYHPVAPFITEELWQRLTAGKFPSIGLQSFPKAAVPTTENKDDDIKSFEQLLSLNTFINQHVSNYGIPKNNEVVLRTTGSVHGLLESNKHILSWLNRKIALLTVIDKEAEILNEKDYVPKEYNSLSSDNAVTVYLLVNGLLDVDKEYAKNGSKIAKLQKQKGAIEELQNGKDYATKASKELKEKHKAQLLGYSKEIDLVKEINNSLKKFKIDG